jgi:hypothetical protein
LRTAAWLRQPDGREDDDCAAARERREPLRERAADVIKRQSKQDFSPGLRAQDQVADPSLVDLVAVRMPHKLGRAGRAAGVEVRGDVVGGNAAPARKPVGRILREQRVVAMDAVLLVARAVHLQDRFQARQLAPHALDFLPDVGAGRRRERHEYFRSGRAQDFRDLPRFEQRIHRVRDPGGFRAIEREEALRQQRQHEADDVARSDAEIGKQIRGLRDLRDELRMRDRQRRSRRARSAAGSESPAPQGRAPRRFAALRTCLARRCARHTASPRRRAALRRSATPEAPRR